MLLKNFRRKSQMEIQFYPKHFVPYGECLIQSLDYSSAGSLS